MNVKATKRTRPRPDAADADLSRTIARLDRPRGLLTFARPRCPNCGCVELHHDRSNRQGDGTIKRWARCTQCAARFVYLLE
ncbi:MAG: hypothetical protein GC162_16340 [Planctomycetes bacterium]|nr:hypothetical protein [Planctomycetota bacterium]